MPKQYESIKKQLMKDGLTEKQAEARAAKIYNAQRKPGQAPVGPGRHGGKSRAKK